MLWFVFQPFLEKKLKIQDTCGIHNLHAMPGVIGGIVGAISAAAASEPVYGALGWASKIHTTQTSIEHKYEVHTVYPVNQIFYYFSLKNTFDFFGDFAKRVPTVQGGFQAAGLCVALCFGIGGGILVGKRQLFKVHQHMHIVIFSAFVLHY